MAIPRVFIPIIAYSPGSKGGGLVRAVINVVEALKEMAFFCVYTRDRDYGSNEPYENIVIDAWTPSPGGKRFYASASKYKLASMLRASKDVGADLIWLNGPLNSTTLKWVLAKRLGMEKRPYVVSIHGAFAPEALRQKPFKKLIFLHVAKFCGLYNGVLWHVCSTEESKQLTSALGESCQREIAPIVATKNTNSTELKTPEKVENKLRLVFLSRLSPEKNLEFLLERLADVAYRGSVELDVYGAAESPDYEEKVRACADKISDRVTVRFHGAIPHGSVPTMLAKSHFLALPASHENFSYVTLEALQAGVPVILSDRTPWKDLAKENVGWDIPLTDLKVWNHILELVIMMDEADYRCMSHAAVAYANAFPESQDFSAYRKLFTC